MCQIPKWQNAIDNLIIIANHNIMNSDLRWRVLKTSQKGSSTYCRIRYCYWTSRRRQQSAKPVPSTKQPVHSVTISI